MHLNLNEKEIRIIPIFTLSLTTVFGFHQVWASHLPHRAALQFSAAPLRRGCNQSYIFEKRVQLHCE